jgi:aspartyl-tRNA(Asn)/glutamyl-tRNA(Gln) amidotransferase subunit A
VDGLVLGRPRGWLEDPEVTQPAMLAALDAAVAAYEALGARVVDVELPDVDLWDVAAWSVCFAETLSYHQHHVHDVENRDAMGAGLLAAGPYVHTVDYLRALRYRSVAQAQLEKAMAGVSALIVPGASSVAPSLAEVSGTEDSASWLVSATRVMIPFNYTGNPALSLPSGVAGGLPTSVQLIARPHDEATLFALGSAFQSATEHHLAKPPLALEVLT